MYSHDFFSTLLFSERQKSSLECHVCVCVCGVNSVLCLGMPLLWPSGDNIFVHSENKNVSFRRQTDQQLNVFMTWQQYSLDGTTYVIGVLTLLSVDISIIILLLKIVQECTKVQEKQNQQVHAILELT